MQRGHLQKFAAQKRKTFPRPRGGKRPRGGMAQIALKRKENFSQAIHIFFSSKKNVNRLRKTRLAQSSSIQLIINKINLRPKTKPHRLGNGAYGGGRRGTGQGRMGPDGGYRLHTPEGAKAGHAEKRKGRAPLMRKREQPPPYRPCSGTTTQGTGTKKSERPGGKCLAIHFFMAMEKREKPPFSYFTRPR